MKTEIDIHTHTIVSGHAYSTMFEMIKAASEKGLKILGITEHAKGIPGTCDDIYFRNMDLVPRQQLGVQLMLGSEINILDYDGTLSLDKRVIDCLDVRIAGIHRFCYTAGSVEENTSAVVGAIRNPEVDIISHPDDGDCPLDYETVVKNAKEYHTLLEINNSSLESTRKNVRQNCAEILRLCKKNAIPVLVSSDAHYMTEIAVYTTAEKLIAECDFPEELIINNSAEKFREFISENRSRKI
jgi:putative hydrolase